MAMMTLAVRMQMFGIVHGHARLQIKKVGWCAITAGRRSRAARFTEATLPT